VHVPFCAAPCPYCHFSKEQLSGAGVERWLAALELEAMRRAEAARGVAFRSLFFGGGSPSALSARHFRRAWDTVTRHFVLGTGAEVTLEANPEAVKPSLLDAWASAGVNRLSMGAQSLVPAELAALGRIHDENAPARAFSLARSHGFQRLSVDLMFGYPGHTLATWERTLDLALALDAGHLSAYGYIVEDGTPLGDAVARGECSPVPPEIEAEMHARADARFAAQGLAAYETSNWSRPGDECRHNLAYWLRRDYLALGPSSHALWRGERWANARALGDWAARLERGEDPAVEREPETAASRAEETLLLGLRLAAGLDPADLTAEARAEFETRYLGALEGAVELGRLEHVAGRWRIPAAQRFVADDTIAWIAVRAASPTEVAA
jgi:oxygen-independent coproporphyrinogen-3 oxidase